MGFRPESERSDFLSDPSATPGGSKLTRPPLRQSRETAEVEAPEAAAAAEEAAEECRMAGRHPHRGPFFYLYSFFSSLSKYIHPSAP